MIAMINRVVSTINRIAGAIAALLLAYPQTGDEVGGDPVAVGDDDDHVLGAVGVGLLGDARLDGGLRVLVPGVVGLGEACGGRRKGDQRGAGDERRSEHGSDSLWRVGAFCWPRVPSVVNDYVT